MPWFKRRPRITEENYGRLMTSFGRLADKDPFIWGPAAALVEQVVAAEATRVAALDARLWEGAAAYHLRLLAASWLMAAEGSIPAATAEVFEEAVTWKFEPLVKGSGALAHRLSVLARGEGARDYSQAEGLSP